MKKAENWLSAWGRFSRNVRFMCSKRLRLSAGRGPLKRKEDTVRRARILVVDDQAYVREFLSEELGQDGYSVASAGDAESIWRFLENPQV